MVLLGSSDIIPTVGNGSFFQRKSQQLALAAGDGRLSRWLQCWEVTTVKFRVPPNSLQCVLCDTKYSIRLV